MTDGSVVLSGRVTPATLGGKCSLVHGHAPGFRKRKNFRQSADFSVVQRQETTLQLRHCCRSSLSGLSGSQSTTDTATLQSTVGSGSLGPELVAVRAGFGPTGFVSDRVACTQSLQGKIRVHRDAWRMIHVRATLSCGILGNCVHSSSPLEMPAAKDMRLLLSSWPLWRALDRFTCSGVINARILECMSHRFC